LLLAATLLFQLKKNKKDPKTKLIDWLRTGGVWGGWPLMQRPFAGGPAPAARDARGYRAGFVRTSRCVA